MNTIIGSMEQKIFDIMTVAPVTVDMQDAVYKVEEVLNEHGLSSVPVIDPERRDCFGIISLKDIAHFNAAKKNSRAVRAWEICSYKPQMADPEASIEDVARLMVEHQIHHVVVVENGLLKGFVSSLDIIAACLPLRSRK
jgi:CBS domain-containing protein